MPFNGSGTYTPPGADFPAVTLTAISSTKYNNVVNDVASALTNCVTRDGQSPMTAALPMGAQSIVNIGAGSAASPSLRWNTADGLYSPGAGQLSFSTSGTNRATIGTTGAWTFAAPTSALPVVTLNGIAASPVLAIVPADGSSAVDVTKSQNAETRGLTVSNVNAGASALASAVFTNGTSYLQLIQYGTGTSNANVSLVFASGAGGLQLNANAGKLALNTGGVERWQIDSVGRLLNTNNSQPSFCASSSATRSGGPGLVEFITYATENHDYGSNFNPSTGRFTAPVAGAYLISFAVFGTGASSDAFYAQLLKNSATVLGAPVAYFPQEIDEIYTDQTTVLILAASDYISVWGDPGSASKTLNCTLFTARLLG